MADKKTENKINAGFESADVLNTDFKNFKFADFNDKEFQLKNGSFNYINPITKLPQNYQFRKVYYFDISR